MTAAATCKWCSRMSHRGPDVSVQVSDDCFQYCHLTKVHTTIEAERAELARLTLPIERHRTGKTVSHQFSIDSADRIRIAPRFCSNRYDLYGNIHETIPAASSAKQYCGVSRRCEAQRLDRRSKYRTGAVTTIAVTEWNAIWMISGNHCIYDGEHDWTSSESRPIVINLAHLILWNRHSDCMAFPWNGIVCQNATNVNWTSPKS